MSILSFFYCMHISSKTCIIASWMKPSLTCSNSGLQITPHLQSVMLFYYNSSQTSLTSSMLCQLHDLDDFLTISPGLASVHWKHVIFPWPHLHLSCLGYSTLTQAHVNLLKLSYSMINDTLYYAEFIYCKVIKCTVKCVIQGQGNRNIGLCVFCSSIKWPLCAEVMLSSRWCKDLKTITDCIAL